jgi:hypothetical protein
MPAQRKTGVAKARFFPTIVDLTLGRRERSILLRHPVVSVPKLRARKRHLRGRAVHRHPRRIRFTSSQ